MKKISVLTGMLLILLLYSGCQFNKPQEPVLKNILFFIGDGMGPAQVEAAGLYQSGAAGTLSFEQFPYITSLTNASADNTVTDSAAAATAMATGQKVNNQVISRKIPGDGSNLYTILEYFRDHGLKTGLTTTAYITHATPAAFGAHTAIRSDIWAIALDYLHGSRPNLLLGGGANGMTSASAIEAGYWVVETKRQMLNLNLSVIQYISGQFGTDHLPYEFDGYDNAPEMPHLTEMTSFSIEFLSHRDNGFFLMVEGGRIDHAGHENNIARNIQETLEFSRAVNAAVSWMGDRRDTLIIVTADHETGGLSVTQAMGQGNIPAVTWSTGGHTDTPVNAYALGFRAEGILQIADNTDFYGFLIESYEYGRAK